MGLIYSIYMEWLIFMVGKYTIPMDPMGKDSSMSFERDFPDNPGDVIGIINPRSGGVRGFL